MFNPIADFLAMRREVAARSSVMDAWGFLLNVPTLIGGLIFVYEPAGMAVVAAIVISLLIASQLHKRMPMSRLLGLCHVVFLPVIALLAIEVAQGGGITAFGIWVTYSLVLMSACVLMDLFDLYRYFVQGNRSYAETRPK